MSFKEKIDYLVDYVSPPPDFSSDFKADDAHKRVFVLEKKLEELQKRLSLLEEQGCSTHLK